jgi:hypothetical protein
MGEKVDGGIVDLARHSYLCVYLCVMLLVRPAYICKCFESLEVHRSSHSSSPPIISGNAKGLSDF